MKALSEAIGRVLRHQREFDGRLARIEAALSLPPPVANPATPPAPPRPPTPPRPPAPPRPPTAPEPVPAAVAPSLERAHLETDIGLNLVNRIGVITLVLGIGFFFKWAVDNEWIGPAARVALGIAAGLATLAGGNLLSKRNQRIFAQGVTGTGISILYLSIYAAFGFYHLIPQALAFALLAAVTLVAAALSLRYDSAAIAALGAFGGYLTPLMLSTGADRPWFLFTYVLLLDVGALALTRARSWRLLERLAFAATMLLYWAWLAGRLQPHKQLPAAVFDFLYYALFAPFTALPVFVLAQFAAAAAIVAIWPRDAGLYFMFSLAVALAGLVLADIRRSSALAAAAFAGAWICFAFWNFLSPVGAALSTLLAGVACTFILFIAGVLWWTLGRREQARPVELIILAVNGVACFGTCYGLLNPAHHAWLGALAIAIAGIYLALAFIVSKARQEADRNAIALTLAFSLGFLTLAIPIQFAGYRITMAWAVEAAALTWIAVRAAEERMHWGALAIFLLAAFRLLALDAWILPHPRDYALLLNARFLTFAISAAALWAAAYWVRDRPTAPVYYIAGHAIMLAALSMEVLGWAERASAAANLEGVETVSISVLWAFYAVFLVGLGVRLRFVLDRLMGLILIGIVVLKLYIYDVWQLARVFRILAFVVLGLLLLATSYLYSRYRSTIEGWWKNENSSS